VNWALVLVPLLLVGVGVGTYVFLRSDGGEPPPAAKPKPFLFTRGQTHFFSIGGSAAKLTPEQKEAARAGVDGVMSDVYDAAFVTRSRWEGGAFSSVLQHFAPEALEEARKDLAELTLGSEARRLQSVKPESGILEVAFLLRKLEPMAAIATTEFHAQGRLSGGGGLSVTHEGKYFLRLIDGQWRIVGYEVDGALDSGGPGTPTGRPGTPTPAETTP
jgi:hypothetical protein